MVFKSNLSLGLMLGWQDVRQSYRRSPVGPFWVTITTGVLIATIGFVFGVLFEIPYKDYLPYLAIGILVWNFMNSVINDASSVFVGSAELVKQIKLPIFVYVLRLMWRNLTIFLHNLILIPLLYLILQVPISWTLFLTLIGLFIVLLCLASIVVGLGIVATRYRDFAQLTTSFLTVFFYLTPVMWQKEGLDASAVEVLVKYNPFAILLSLIRDPLLGLIPPLETWISGLLLAAAGWMVAGLIVRRYSSRVVYWL